jgi:hypothetical protein
LVPPGRYALSLAVPKEALFALMKEHWRAKVCPRCAILHRKQNSPSVLFVSLLWGIETQASLTLVATCGQGEPR